MSAAGAMDQPEYRLEDDVAIVDVNGDIDVLTSGACVIAFLLSPARAMTGW